jgi:hypothetical protein
MVRFVRNRPPKLTLYLDATLRNHTTETRWFILPLTVQPSVGIVGGGVFSVDVFELAGRGRAILGRFLGTGGFQALCLPPQSTVRVRDVAVSSWRDLPDDQLILRCATARHVQVGGSPIEEWMGPDFVSDSDADVSGADGRPLSDREEEGWKEVAVQRVDEERLSVTVPVADAHEADT